MSSSSIVIGVSFEELNAVPLFEEAAVVGVDEGAAALAVPSAITPLKRRLAPLIRPAEGDRDVLLVGGVLPDAVGAAACCEAAAAPAVAGFGGAMLSKNEINR